jgi:hypothetical protein
VEPMLAAPTDRLPAGAGWVYEPKWDGSPDTCCVSSERAAVAGETRRLSARMRDPRRAVGGRWRNTMGRQKRIDSQAKALIAAFGAEAGRTLAPQCVTYRMLEPQAARPRRACACPTPASGGSSTASCHQAVRAHCGSTDPHRVNIVAGTAEGEA